MVPRDSKIQGVDMGVDSWAGAESPQEIKSSKFSGKKVAYGNLKTALLTNTWKCWIKCIKNHF